MSAVQSDVDRKMIDGLTAQPAALDLDSSIRIDGKSVTIRELISIRDEAAKQADKLKELESFRSTVLPAFRPGSQDTNAVQTAIRAGMLAAGLTEDDIAQYEAASTSRVAVKSQQNGQRSAQNSEGDELEDELDDATIQKFMNHPEMKKFMSRVDAISGQTATARGAQVKGMLIGALDKAFAENGDIRVMRAASEHIRGPEETTKGMQSIRNSINTAAENILLAKIQKEKITNVTDTVVAECVEQATKQHVDLLRNAFGNFEAIGPASTVNMEGLRERLERTDPVAPPDPNTTPRTDVMDKLDEYLLDHVTRNVVLDGPSQSRV